MATNATTLRRGLPRHPGGEPWPSGGAAPVASVPDTPRGASTAEEPAFAIGTPTAAVAAPPGRAGTTAGEPHGAPVTPASPIAEQQRAIRRGLPRLAGGDPWPPAGETAVSVASAAVATSPAEQVATVEVPPTHLSPPAAAARHTVSAERPGPAVRRGLPRVPGGEPWPPTDFVPAAHIVVAVSVVEAAPVAVADEAIPVRETAASETPSAPPSASVASFPASRTRAPLSAPRTVWPGVAASAPRPAPAPDPMRVGPFTKLQWAGAVVVGGAGVLVAGILLVALTRWVLSLPFMQEFLAAYPGEYHLPDTAPVGIPGWIGWQHFFNTFLMVLIIRSGLQVRHQAKPPAYWTPRWNPSRKISVNLWFHQSLDILWLVNGAVFVVLLFVTGQWMRIVPTSWEVFPNALSAALQYVSLDWPTENGWVNYNGLQQLAYFTTVFVAAPLAAITGVRMSGRWPKNATALNRIYPVELARAIHFPVMLYFVLFIIVHVTLVLATGALRNLNHMYAAQGSVDGVRYADNWAGFWIFLASAIVITSAWVAARPLVLAPIARLFGTVSAR